MLTNEPKRFPRQPRSWRTSGHPFLVIATIFLTSQWLLGVVRGAVPHEFSSGDTISASEVNANFANLDSRLAAVEAARDSEEIDEHVAAPAVVYDTEVSSISDLHISGIRVGDTFYLSLALRFELATGNNVDASVLHENNFDFLDGRSVVRVSGTFATNVNSAGTGSIVGGFIRESQGEEGAGHIALEYFGQFLNTGNRLLYGTMVVVAPPDA